MIGAAPMFDEVRVLLAWRGIVVLYGWPEEVVLDGLPRFSRNATIGLLVGALVSDNDA